MVCKPTIFSTIDEFTLAPSRALSIASVCIPVKNAQAATERALRTRAAKARRLPKSAAPKASKEFVVTAG
jgi:hypothetical protein